MRGTFDYRDLDQQAQRHDTELTLGAGSLLLIFFGLVLLCGLCFGLGYTTGHSGVQATAPGSATDPFVAADAGHAKPTGSAPAAQVSSAAVDADAKEPSDAYDAQTPASHPSEPGPAPGTAPGPAPGPAPAQQQVKPALGAVPSPIQGAQPAASAVGPALAGPAQTGPSQTGPALTGPGALMVQIAAIAAQPDADVLVGALRRHGYAVVERREPLDGLIHVRIGPFKTRDEAEQWRQKLLNDGYNAIVQE